jgi:hypothetical protein
MKPLSENDLRWLEGRIETHGITQEDRRRLLSDLRATRAVGIADAVEAATGVLGIMRDVRETPDGH